MATRTGRATESELWHCFKCGVELTVSERFAADNLDNLCVMCRRTQADKKRQREDARDAR